jgi:hypothetical protein
MATAKAILSELLANAPDTIDSAGVAELAKTAETLARLGASAPPVAPKPKTDPVSAARARLAELDASPLPAGARDYQRIERANERARLVGEIYESTEFGMRPRGGDAA